jgi:hypothetical protein
MPFMGRLTCRTWEVKPRNNDAAGQKIHRSGSVLRTRVPLRTNSKFPTPPRAFMGWLLGRVSQRTLPWAQDAKFQITLPTPSARMSPAPRSSLCALLLAASIMQQARSFWQKDGVRNIRQDSRSRFRPVSTRFDPFLATSPDFGLWTGTFDRGFPISDFGFRFSFGFLTSDFGFWHDLGHWTGPYSLMPICHDARKGRKECKPTAAPSTLLDGTPFQSLNAPPGKTRQWRFLHHKSHNHRVHRGLRCTQLETDR